MNEECAHLLKGTPLFKSFTDTGIQIVASIAQEKRIPDGAPLFVEQMVGESLFVIAEGQIRLWVRGPQGQEIPLVVLGPKESLGEAAVLRSGPRLCSATAQGATRVLEISRRDVAALQKNKPQAAIKLMISVIDVLAERTSEAGSDLRQLLLWRAAGT